MTAPSSSTRTIITLSAGARLGAVLSLILLVLAVYLYWSPIQLAPPSGGFPIHCGSAAAPPTDDLSNAACGQINEIRQWQAGTVVAAAVVLALGSVYAFGVRRRDEELLGARAVEESPA